MKKMRNPLLLLLFLCPFILQGQNDVSIFETYMEDHLPPGEHPVTVYFQNNGSEQLESISVQWRLNGGTIHTEFVDLEETPIVPSVLLHSYTTTEMLELTEGIEDYLLEVWVADPNGQSDVNMSDNYDSHNISILPDYCEKKTLLEPHMSTDDSFGPDVDLVISQMQEQYPGLLVAAWHTDDPMESDQNSDIWTSYDIGHTFALIDRHLFPPVYEGEYNKPSVDYEVWDQYIPLLIDNYSPVHLQTTNTYNSTTRDLTVDITASFLADLQGDYRFNCYIIESPVADNVVGDGAAPYEQLNRYSSQGPASGGEDHPYYDYPSSIEDFQHKNVVWNRLGGAWGTQGIIPFQVNDNSIVNHQYTYTLPDHLDESEVSVIVMVQKYDPDPYYRNVMNSLDCELNSSNQHAWLSGETAPPPPAQDYHTFGGKILLEGAYQGNGFMNSSIVDLLPFENPFINAPYNYSGSEVRLTSQNNLVDWVLIEARTGTPNSIGEAGTEVIETRAALILADGFIVDMEGNPGVNFYNLTDGQPYHFCVRHRNHLDILTAVGLPAQINMFYDFTSASNMAFGHNQQKMHGNKAVMYVGDYNQDGIIQSSDLDTWLQSPAVNSTYMNTDGNLDGSVLNTDFDMWFYNKAKIGNLEIRF